MAKTLENSPQLTVEALHYYVPIFQRGDEALERMLNEDLTIEQINYLENCVTLRKLALDRMIELARPLIITEIRKMIDNSLLKNDESIFNLLFYAGIDGMVRGLRKFDVDKIDKSATNYLFQWITTYARKDLLIAEAPFGIAPYRYNKYKKISAVRKKIEDLWEREPSNEEVLAYFHDGSADMNTMHGPLIKAPTNKANRSITLELVVEQDEFERNMKKVQPLDHDDYRNASLFSYEPKSEYSLIRTFIDSYNFTDIARVHMLGEIDCDLTIQEQDIMSQIDKATHRKIKRQWKALLSSPNGPFYEYLSIWEEDPYLAEEATPIIRALDKVGVVSPEEKYSELFINKTIRSIK